MQAVWLAFCKFVTLHHCFLMSGPKLSANQVKLDLRLRGNEARTYTLCAMAIVAVTCVTLSANWWNGLSDMYYDYFVSEWMINYEGGFVRRGLTGQLLLWLTQLTHWPLHLTIVWIDIFSAAAAVGTVVVLCLRRGWYPLLPLAILVGALGHYRRDFLVLLMVFGLWWLLVRWLKHGGRACLAGFVVLLSLLILSYEPAFFFTVPISMVVCAWQLRARHGRLAAMCRLAAIFAVPLLAMALVCHFNGSVATADAIWDSWLPYISDYYGADKPMGCGVDFLRLPTTDAFALHLRMNYGIGSEAAPLGFHPNMILAEVLMLGAMLYLTAMMPIVGIKSASERARREGLLLGDVFVVQLLGLLPMLTVLSCDFGRTMLCLIYSTTVLVHLLSSAELWMEVPLVHGMSVRLLRLTDRWPWLRWWWVYVLVLLCVPFNFVNGVSFSTPLIRSCL